MSQTVQDIIARSAWAVDDEFYEVLKKGELIKTLDRVYREYCDKTGILSQIIGFKTTNSMEYELAGPVDDGTYFGDEFKGIYRLEYNEKRAVEKVFEDIKNFQLDLAIINNEVTPVPYAIRYLNNTRRIYFPFIPNVDDEVIFWWYRVPRIGTLSTMTSTFSIDDRRTDDLVLGLNVIAWRSLFVRYTAKGKRDAAQIAIEEFKLSKEEWKSKLLEVERSVKGFTEDITPTQVEIPSPFEDLGDDTDYVVDYYE